MTQPAAADAAPKAPSPIRTYYRNRALVAGGLAVCLALFWWVGGLVGFPVHRGYEASLMQQPGWPALWLAMAVVLALCAAIGTAVARVVRFNAGLFIALLAMAAWSLRGGTSRDVLRWADRDGILLWMALESVLLFAAVAALWMAFCRARDRGWLADAQPQPENTGGRSTRAWAALIQTLAMGLLVLLLAASEAKQQSLAVVFIGAYVATGLADFLFPRAGMRPWYWIGPALVASLGYTLTWLMPEGRDIANLQGPFAALARPLPLDYASAGSAGALLGTWVGARMFRGVADLFGSSE